MIVTLPYCSTDQPNAQRLVDWFDELGANPNHDLILFREQSASPIKHPKRFRSVEEIVFTDHWKKWPVSTTNAFQTAARHVENHLLKPFLFLEPDCIPLTSDCLDEIEREYNRANRPFMGAYVPQHGDVPEHLSGVAVYPSEMTKYAGQALLLSDDAPWDTAVGSSIVQQAHCTDLIQHHWRHPGFKSMDEVRGRITSECRLWHSDKTDSLIQLLRNNLSGGSNADAERGSLGLKTSELDDTSSTTAHEEISPPAQNLPNGEGLTRGELARDAVAVFKKLCPAPRYISQVRKELKRQGVTK